MWSSEPNDTELASSADHTQDGERNVVEIDKDETDTQKKRGFSKKSAKDTQYMSQIADPGREPERTWTD